MLGNQRSNVEEKFTPEKHTWEPFTQVLGDLGSTLSAKRQQGWVVSKGRKGGRNFRLLSPVGAGAGVPQPWKLVRQLSNSP